MLLFQAAPIEEVEGPLARQEKALGWAGRTCSLDGHELGTSGGTNTDFTVTNGLVGHGVLTEVVSDHIGSDFDSVPVLAGVDFTDGADHLGHDDAVSEVGLDWCWLLAVLALLDGLSELLDEAVVTRVDTTSESSLLAGAEHVDHLGCAKFKQLFELDTSVKLLSECFFLGSLLGLGGGKSFGDRRHI